MLYFRSITAALVAVLGATPGIAAEYNANHFFAERHSLVLGPYVEFADKVAEATNGEIIFRVFSGGSLVPANASLQGVRDGVSHVTYHAGTYTSAELPVENLISNMVFYNTDPMVLALASTEFSMTNDQALAEWRKNGVVFGGGYATPEYKLMCNKPIETLIDLEGKRIRDPGGAWSRFTEFVNAVPVSIPSSEMYTGLDTGALDCNMSPGDALVSFSLHDVVTHMNTLAIGNYFSGFLWGYNTTFWQNLTDEQRSVLLQQMAHSLVEGQVAYSAAAQSAIDDARESGMAISEPDEALKAALARFAEADQATLLDTARDRGVDNPEEILEEFKDIIDRWDDLLNGVDRTNVEAIVEIAKAQLYNKIDSSTYGID